MFWDSTMLTRMIGPLRNCVFPNHAQSLALLLAGAATSLLCGCFTLPHNYYSSSRGPALKDEVRDEIRYLCTQEESDTLESLSADDELKSFLENFWERRDPTPETPSNELRTEYERRLAFVKE